MIRFIPNAAHDMHIAVDGGFGGAASLVTAPTTSTGFAPGYTDLVTSWVKASLKGCRRQWWNKRHAKPNRALR
jgi:hypothetical protein